MVRIYFFLYFISFSLLIFAEENEKNQTICLNMIVKNESAVIKRCLESVRPMVDYWVIVDTGSEDDTREIIREYYQDIPGELYDRPWKNFGHNRNEALELAKGKSDYILFIDADEILVFDEQFKLPPLKKDFYTIMTHFNGTNYGRVQLIKDSLNWKWTGVLHEAVDSPEARTSEMLVGVINQVYTDGARSQDPAKFQKDIQVLEEGVRNEPENSRYVFYLAQSYKDGLDYENSIKYYQKRIEMGGWNEEVFWSMLQIGIMKQVLSKPSEEVLESYYKAYHYRPSRLEPLYYLANYYRTKNDYASGYLIASIANNIPVSKDILFVQKWMYDYGILLELSICAYWVGKYVECAQISHQMLNNKELPVNVRECVQRNLTAANAKMVEMLMK